jgi:hypothetical protein
VSVRASSNPKSNRGRKEQKERERKTGWENSRKGETRKGTHIAICRIIRERKQASVSVTILARRETEQRGDERRKHNITIKACERNIITHERNCRRRQNARSDQSHIEHKSDMTEEEEDATSEDQDIDT